MRLTARCFRTIVVLLVALACCLPGMPGHLTARAQACTVTTGADSGPGSLRALIGDASCASIVFAGDYTITLAGQLAIARNVTIDGTGHNVTVSGNQAARVFQVNSGVTFYLNAITVANGKAASDAGGGIYSSSGTVAVTNCTFSGNSAAYWGGAIDNSWGTLTVTGCTFTGNTATYGGAISNWNLSGTLHVTDSSFSNNSATNGGGIYNSGGALNVTRGAFTGNDATSGGGIYNSDTHDLIVTDSTFSANTATDGGAIYNGGDLSVTGSTFAGNTAALGGGIHSYQDSGGFVTTVTNSAFSGNGATSGGGVYNDGTTLAVTNGTFSANTGNHYGGAIHNHSGTATVTNSTFANNEAFYSDGAIWHGHGAGIHNDSTLHVTGSTFSHNEALWGGGISNAATLHVTNSTFSGNPGDAYGGGIYNQSGTATVTNSTFSGNIAGVTGGGIYNHSGMVTVNNSLVVASTPGGNCAGAVAGSNSLADDGSCGAGFATSASVLLGALGAYGGGTQTFPLLPGSAAIGATSTNCPGTDQRGVPRSLPVCDIGAFESQGFAFGSLTGTPQTALVNTAFATPLGLAVAANNAIEPVDGGKVTFTLPGSGASAVLAGNPATIAGGRASISATANGVVGSYSVAAGAAGVTAPATFHLANLTHTTTTLNSSANPSPGPAVTFTAIVDPTPLGGTVTFRTNGVDIAGCFGVSLAAGQATCTPGALARGAQSITAVYSGFGNHLGSTSGTFVQWSYPRPAIDVGDSHVCEQKTDGSVFCWGMSSFGILEVPLPNAAWLQLSTGWAHTCGLKTDGTMRCWGWNEDGQTNIPHPNENWVQVTAGYGHTCGLKAGGTLTCWGRNYEGQATVPTPNENWLQVSTTTFHTCGLKSDGTLRCWGENRQGQLNIPSPNAGWIAVSTGYRDTCGLKADGSQVCWGSAVADNDVPVPNVGWEQADVGDGHACAIRSDGTLACWGANYAGQSNVPGTISPWVQVATGTSNTCGLRADGTIECWGANYSGQTPVVTLAPATLPDARVGAGYAQNLGASGGTAAPYTFSVIAGSLPPGLTLDAGGTWSGAPTSPGTFSFTAQAVDANNIAGTRDYVLVVRVPTTTALASMPNPSVYGQSVTLTATVGESDAATPTGTVTFKEGETTLGTGSLNGLAQATYTTSAFAVGNHQLTAEYSGDAGFVASMSPVSVQTVDKAGTTTIWTADADDPSLVGQAVPLCFAVSADPPGSGVPGGSVTVSDGEGTTCSGALVAGNGSCSLTFATPGSKTLTATYTGDGSFHGSVSSGEAHTVTAEDTYADPAGLCGGNIPCFGDVQSAIDAAAMGHTVTVYGGMYDESVALDRNVAVVLAGDVTLGGSFLQSSGVFAGGSGEVAVGGDWTLSGGSLAAPASLHVSGHLAHTGGTFAHNNGIVTMNGSGVRTLSGSLTFYDLAIAPGTIVDVGSDPLFGVDGVLANDGALRQTRLTPGGTPTEFLHILNGAHTADRYRGLALEPVSDMAATTVTVFGNQRCPGVTQSVQRCFEVEPGAVQTAAVTFYLTDAERDGLALSSLRAWHWNGSRWEQQTGATTWGGSGDGQWVRVEGIAAYSPFSLAGGSPTAGVLARFEARWEDAGPRLEWQTASEVAVMGFYLYRSEAEDGPLTRLNEALFPGQAPGSSLGAAYSFLDETAVAGVRYYYWLDVVGIDGGATRHGPVVAPARGDVSYSLYLPLLQRAP